MIYLAFATIFSPVCKVTSFAVNLAAGSAAYALGNPIPLPLQFALAFPHSLVAHKKATVPLTE